MSRPSEALELDRMARREGPDRQRSPGIILLSPELAATHGRLAREVREAESEARKARLEICPPPFLGGQYRPRNLTRLGGDFMRELDPEGPWMLPIQDLGARDFGARVDPYLGADPLRIQGDIQASLEQRYAYLARRYTALDLVRKGLAFEARGRFYPKQMEDRREEIQVVVALYDGYRLGDAAGPKGATEALNFDHQDLRIWLAMGRRVGWDQVMALRPNHRKSLDRMLLDLMDEGQVEEVRVPMGRGSISGLSLTKGGWQEAQRLDPDLKARGFGPHLRSCPGQEYHESAVFDAVQYFNHSVEAEGSRVLGVTLDEGLKRLEPNQQRGVADFRLEIETRVGVWTALEIEVMGVSKHYRASHRAASSAGCWRAGFDPIGRQHGGSKNFVRVGR